MGDLTDSLTPSASTPISHSRPMPVREDCWSEEATSTLIDAWGRRYLELNRGNLRQKDWQEVADAVNALHGHTKKTHRTDVQCKNRIDTIKKKYKVEKARVSSSNGALSSSWLFFDRLDALIGSNLKKPSPSSLSPSPPVAVPLPIAYRKNPSSAPAAASTVVVLPQKRSAAAAAAAAASSAGDEGAIERFGRVYERVEGEKLRQMVELEKQRMQFAKDLEVQRMRMFMDTQVQLERIKRGRRSGSNGETQTALLCCPLFMQLLLFFPFWTAVCGYNVTANSWYVSWHCVDVKKALVLVKLLI
ncbi:hypothetical protein FEM48_Zijuj01G0043100 [Ziziphus jujuba var. spinosa]|uniref:Myb/SANT-like DNA-binding domain-containing protein n=1 Tax=Ziziphus jujuba var. spinosa TaxID=714518 RepID=A0A978VZ41_ZIZJJ|nr:hypothetical protein FEM48_Zijuj01G0043100 [Ziziphus jujuba var. spinosa]